MLLSSREREKSVFSRSILSRFEPNIHFQRDFYAIIRSGKRWRKKDSHCVQNTAKYFIENYFHILHCSMSFFYSIIKSRRYTYNGLIVAVPLISRLVTLTRQSKHNRRVSHLSTVRTCGDKFSCSACSSRYFPGRV